MPKGDGIKIPEWEYGQPSRWVVAGSMGRRVLDKALYVAAMARMMMLDAGVNETAVHADDCNLGYTTPEPCNCQPEVITR